MNPKSTSKPNVAPSLSSFTHSHKAKNNTSSQVPLAIFLPHGPSAAPGTVAIKAVRAGISVRRPVTKETPSYVHRVTSLHVADLPLESGSGMACKSLMNTHGFQQIFNEVAFKVIMKWYRETKYFDSQTVGFITTVTLLVTYTIITSCRDSQNKFVC